jgi:DNA-binding NtrC family response regulator
MARVLIVDDELGFRQTLCRFVSRLGHQAEAAGGGESALEVGQRFDPDLLVVDWMLGGSLNGLEVAQLLSAAKPSLRTIVISGYPSAELASQTENAQIVAFLEKPFDFAQLREAFEKASIASNR